MQKTGRLAREALWYGFDTFRKNLGLVAAYFAIYLTCVIGFLLFCMVMFGGDITWQYWYLISIGNTANQAWQLIQAKELVILRYLFPFIILGTFFQLLLFWFHVGLIKMALDIYDTGTSSIRVLFSPARMVAKVILAQILTISVVTVGMMLLVIPGFYFIIKLGLASYFIIEKDAGIIESLKLSYRATAGVFWDFLLLFAVMFGIGIGFYYLNLLLLPQVAFILSKIYSILIGVVYAFALTYMYKKVTAETKSKE